MKKKVKLKQINIQSVGGTTSDNHFSEREVEIIIKNKKLVVKEK